MSSQVAALKEPDHQIDLDSMPSFLLNHIVHQWQQTLHSRLKALGCTTLKMRIVLSLQTYGRLTVGELCNCAIAEQPTMSRALDSLEAQGMVRREHSDADSRLRLVSLTSAGLALCDRIGPEFVRTNDALLAGMSGNEKAEFMRLLNIVLGNLRKI